jgi:hypothetical protein
MPGLHEGSEALTSASIRAPKTVLGYFAVALGLLCTTAVGLVWAFARTPALHHLIQPVMIFVGIVVVVLIVGVFITAWIDPTILMLGQVTGEIYMANRRRRLGDAAESNADGDRDEARRGVLQGLGSTAPLKMAWYRAPTKAARVSTRR